MTPIQLTRGQAHRLHLEPGDWLCAEQGGVTLNAEPLWLADTVWHASVVIPAGQAHVVDAAGWVTLVTDAASAELRLVPAPSRNTPRRLAGTLLTLARRAFA